MGTMSEALFVLDGELLIPSDLTRTGWSDDAQHGSPPSGILARAIELVPTAVPMQVVRFTIDLFRPVPISPLKIATTVRRDGKRIQVVDAYLYAGELEVGRASGLKIRLSEIDLPDRDEKPWDQPPGPSEAEGVEFRGSFGGENGLRRFHTDAVDIRTVGGSFLAAGPGVSWFRLRQPLIEGEALTPFIRVATIADMSNGNSQALDPRQWIYVNPDITLYLHRLSGEEWIGMKSAAHQHHTGIGVSDTRVFDLDGPIGRINQAQILDRR